MKTDDLTHAVIGCAIEVHKTLGPGLLESTYEACLIYELNKLGFTPKSQVDLPVYYKDTYINAGYRLDILLPDNLIIELKSVDKLLPIHSAQLITYMNKEFSYLLPKWLLFPIFRKAHMVQICFRKRFEEVK